jgi:hypothetical protein
VALPGARRTGEAPERESLTVPASPLTAWESFYIIIGSSSAALTGLMFIVITLVSEARTRNTTLTSAGGGSEISAFAAFGTPTIVHFCASFFVSAVLTAPWREAWHAGLVVGATGLFGVAYTCIVIRRARRQHQYRPVFEDWLWHTILPLVAYISMLVATILLPSRPTPALFTVAGATILPLFIGIHNAWDTVVYTVEKLPSGSETTE